MAGTHDHGPQPRWMVNPLTGMSGIYAPFPLGETTGRRPLPVVSSDVLNAPCVLCAQLPADTQRTVTARNNPTPLGDGHRLFVWSRHIVSPRDSTVSEWQDFIDQAAHTLSQKQTRAGGVAWGNFGLHSGASQHHMHAHAMPTVGDSGAEGRWNGPCGLCTRDCPTLARQGKWRAAWLPGGRHGEIVLAPWTHGRDGNYCDGLAELLALSWQAFATAGWDSGRLLWHTGGHQHLHLQPAITAEGALEAAGGIAVSRWGEEHLRPLFPP